MDGGRIYKLKMDPEQVEKFQTFFMEKSGLVFEGRRIQEMERAVASRMIELGISSFDEYHGRLKIPRKGKDELGRLVLTLTAGETQSYRTPEQFAALRKYVIPELIEKEKRQDRQLRILSAGCATGEEPYTLCILLHGLLPDFDTWKINIQACDINKEFIETARKGEYGERKLRLVDPINRNEYFDRMAKNQWRVKDFLRHPIEWLHFNLNSDSFETLNQGEPFHIVLCRNVLIYFKLRNVKRMVRKFHQIIQPGGYLMLGYSETLFKISTRFQSVHTPEAFFYQKTENPTPALPKLPDKPSPYEREDLLKALGSRPHPFTRQWEEKTELCQEQGLPWPEPARAKPEDRASLPTLIKNIPSIESAKTEYQGPAEADGEPEERLWEEALDLFAQERFDEAREKFEQMIKHNHHSARAYLGLGFLYANLGAEDISREHAEKAKHYDDLLPEIYFLLALLDEKNSEFERAVENYQRVILLSPDFAMAHFNLGNLFNKLHQYRDARREFGNTITILEKDRDNISLRFSGGLSRDAVIDFCEMQRDQVAKALPRRTKAR